MDQKRNEMKVKELEEDGKMYKIEYLGEKLEKQYPTRKVIIIGRSGSGKTSISFSLIKDEFKEWSPTVSLDLGNYQIKVNDKIIQIQLWDTCGNDEFAANTPNLFNNTFIAIIVYAIDNKKSFEEVGKWFNILRKRSKESLVYLIGNKCDLINERIIQKIKGEELKQLYNFNYFLETSAKSGFNIINLLDKLAITIYEKEQQKDEKDKEINTGRISLDKNQEIDNIEFKKKKKCC